MTGNFPALQTNYSDSITFYISLKQKCLNRNSKIEYNKQNNQSLAGWKGKLKNAFEKNQHSHHDVPINVGVEIFRADAKHSIFLERTDFY